MSNAGLLLILVLTGCVLFLVWDTYYTGNLEKVKSSMDGHEYLVQSLPDKAEAANLLAKIRAGLEKVVSHLQKISPQDPRTKQILAQFKSDRIQEGTEKSKYTSYSINKGERIVFCLRSRDEKQALVDENTMMFVALHELAHIGTESTGHTQEFWDNFSWILEEAIQVGAYTQQDFKKKPVKYCGTEITSSPLDP